MADDLPPVDAFVKMTQSSQFTRIQMYTLLGTRAMKIQAMIFVALFLIFHFLLCLERIKSLLSVHINLHINFTTMFTFQLDNCLCFLGKCQALQVKRKLYTHGSFRQLKYMYVPMFEL